MKSNCNVCKHISKQGFYCKAYPNGIPTRFIAQLESHNSVQEDQKGNFIFNYSNPKA